MATSRRCSTSAGPAPRLLAGLALCVLLIGAPWLATARAADVAIGGTPASASAVTTVAQEQSPTRSPEAGGAEPVHEGEPLWKSFARLFNFAILVGVLVYFLRAPLRDYLARRSGEIRGDLIKAAETRDAAAKEMERIQQRLASLPAEVEALKKRGAEEIAAEEARIRAAAEAERERLLEQARREIELQLRTAERDLRRHAADLAVGLASERIKRNITDEDQNRLVDRYLAQLGK